MVIGLTAKDQNYDLKARFPKISTCNNVLNFGKEIIFPLFPYVITFSLSIPPSSLQGWTIMAGASSSRMDLPGALDSELCLSQAQLSLNSTSSVF